MKVQPYLFFDGRCEEAIEFYKSVLGGEVTFLMRYKDRPDSSQGGEVPEEYGGKVMHANLQIGSMSVMAADDCTGRSKSFQGFSLSVDVKDKEEGARVFSGLSEGGRVVVEFGETFFSPGFGMLVDRFDVSWMVVTPQN
ncbi:MAG: VOC family protein [Acidobacteriota bacterium]